MSDTGYIDVDGGRLCWDAAGRGAPIVFLHGFSFDRRSWDPQMAALAGACRVVRYDLRGFGASTAPAGPYRHSDDLRVLIETLSIERPLLVGLSLGANIALAYSIEHAAEVAGLVLASPGLPGHRWVVQRPPEAASAYAAVHGAAAGKRFWLGHPIFESLRNYPQAQAAVARMVNDYTGWHWQNPDMQQAGPDIRTQLGAMSSPALVISGDLDVDGYREIAAEIARTVPHGTLVRMSGAGHVMNLEQPEAFTAQVLQFARSVESERTAHSAADPASMEA